MNHARVKERVIRRFLPKSLKGLKKLRGMVSLFKEFFEGAKIRENIINVSPKKTMKSWKKSVLTTERRPPLKE